MLSVDSIMLDYLQNCQLGQQHSYNLFRKKTFESNDREKNLFDVKWKNVLMKCLSVLEE